MLKPSPTPRLAPKVFEAFWALFLEWLGIAGHLAFGLRECCVGVDKLQGLEDAHKFQSGAYRM